MLCFNCKMNVFEVALKKYPGDIKCTYTVMGYYGFMNYKVLVCWKYCM